VRHRGFSPELEAIAAAWFERVSSADWWPPNGKPVAASTCGVWRSTNAHGVEAAIKPARTYGIGARAAAHEKIASDLAFVLGLPVPPVLLLQRPSPPRWCAVSAWAFSEAQPLAPGASLPTRAVSALAALAAFDFWIGAADRSLRNVVVDGEGSHRNRSPPSIMSRA
jgi:hypothetical protein